VLACGKLSLRVSSNAQLGPLPGHGARFGSVPGGRAGGHPLLAAPATALGGAIGRWCHLPSRAGCVGPGGPFARIGNATACVGSHGERRGDRDSSRPGRQPSGWLGPGVAAGYASEPGPWLASPGSTARTAAQLWHEYCYASARARARFLRVAVRLCFLGLSQYQQPGKRPTLMRNRHPRPRVSPRSVRTFPHVDLGAAAGPAGPTRAGGVTSRRLGATVAAVRLFGFDPPAPRPLEGAGGSKPWDQSLGRSHF
jgi:hypothetical protein